MANTTQGMYTPLPQSISDSDSERELQVDNVRTKSVNGINMNFERSATKGYFATNHMMDNRVIKHGFKSMSPVRKCCFFFSILTCFLTTAVFLWVLPCFDNNTCLLHFSNWENQHENLEFKGRINIVKSASSNSNNIALLFKQSLNDKSNRNGVISILGSNGGIAWYIPQKKEPSDLNCYLIDVNGDDVKDCLLLGENGLEAVDPISGQILYHVHDKNTQSKGIRSIDMPVIIPDLNKDGVNEMLTIINGQLYHNKFVIVCGKTGVILTKIVLRQCLEVHGLTYNNNKILFSCANATVTNYFEIPYIDIENSFFNESFDVNPLPRTFNSSLNVEYELGSHKLIINNTGICPECQSTITLLDSKDDWLWSLPQDNSYTMKPTAFVFTKPNMLSLKGHTKGYILKLWQWSNSRTWKKENSLDKRYISLIDSNVHTNIISERIVLITFNDTNVHVINASLIEVTQLCFPFDGESQCQPDILNQEESLLITDLDNDNSQELVSYSSSFDLRDGRWTLISNMKVIRLEAELLKLFEVTPTKLYDVLL